MSLTPPTLRWYQHDAVEAVFKEWETNNSTLIVMATGLGKTVTFCEIVRRLHPQRSIIIAHRTELIDQACASLERIGLRTEIEMAENKADASMFFNDSVIVASVQSLNSGKKDSKRMTKFRPQDFSCLIIDEAHHAVADSYRAVIDHFRQNPNLKICSVTATPDRFDSKALGLICESVAFKFDIAEAVNDGWLVPVEQQIARVDVDYSHIRTTAGDLNGADLARVMEDEKPVQGMVGAAIEVIGSRKAIAFASSVRHAEMCCDIFNRHRQGMAEWICGKTSDDERKKILRRFKSGDIQVLANVGIATEGFDVPDTEVIIMGRPTKSRSLYTQMCLDSATEVLTNSGWKTRETIRHSDLVAGFNMATQEVSYVQIQDIINRTKLANEEMYGISSPMMDVRVTDRHDIVFRVNEGRRNVPSRWMKEKAMNAPTSFTVPCAGFSAHVGVPLSENDLKFIGIVLTDGCVNKITKAVQISQGEHQPWLPEIEECIQKCGFKYGKRVAWRKTKFNQTSRSVLFSISYGQPRGTDKHLSGWSRLDCYLDKNISEPLMRMSTSQFKAFLEGLHLGDGVKHLNRDYTRRSYHIVSARKKFVDRLQQLCAFHGFSSNSSIHLYNENPIWVIHIKPKHTRTVLTKSSDSRPVWGPLPSEPHEPVWCVRNHLGTIVTRRNGKVCIVGNCGRATRTLPGVIDGLTSSYERREAISESAKPVATILDFVGNSGKHKLITTADILGGDFTEEEKEEALKEIEASGKPKRISDAVKEIRERMEKQRLAEAARKAHIIAKVRYSMKAVSPFDAFDIKPKADSKWDTGKPLSEKQRAVLQKMGVNPDELNYAAAKQLLLESFKRREKGLCSLKQAQLLTKYGYSAKNVTFTEASRIIDSLKQNNWQRADLILT